MTRLSEVLNILYPYYNDEEKPQDWLCNLFVVIVGEDVQHPLLNKKPQYIRRLYNGEKELSKDDANFLLNGLKTEKWRFVSYVEETDIDLTILCDKFELLVGNSTDKEIADKIADYLIEVLAELANKKKIRTKVNAFDTVSAVTIEQGLRNIINKLATLTEKELVSIANLNLNLSPAAVGNKIKTNDRLKKEILDDVFQYFGYIKDLLSEASKLDATFIDRLAKAIRSRCEHYCKELKQSQNVAFDNLVNWIAVTGLSNDTIACKAIVSFFVQNCEVFDEIT